MAALDDLIQQVSDPELRARLQLEADRLAKQKKFGLVFEDHIPECTPLYDMSIKRNSQVALKTGEVNDVYRVIKIKGAQAECIHETSHTAATIPLKDLVVVARFGDPIYPCLKLMDSVCNAPNSDLWHTLIEADNYHALQLLEYLYAGKVDCIYIDPPYNTEAKDWKYNNNYVDGSDLYRHSKWLSMMQKRLKIAKKLLNPKDSVLIVTIDEKEYLHLGCLLEEMFPDAKIQMISTVINPKGTARANEFSRVDEYIFFVMIGEYQIARTGKDMLTQDVSEDTSVRWRGFPRTGRKGLRPVNPGSWYPIYFNRNDDSFHSVGDAVAIGEDNPPMPDGTYAIWPPVRNGEEYSWAIVPSTFRHLHEIGAIKFGKSSKGKGCSISYLTNNQLKQIQEGKIKVDGRDVNGSMIVSYATDSKTTAPKTQWNLTTHEAGAYGTNIIGAIIPGRRFAFPKSVYAVRDTINFFVKEKPNALIVDFFAGSGTTLHAVNLLNAEDGGHRQCIMVTNNEVSANEAATLSAKGFNPGDEEWESLGIARYITWPRTECSIRGLDVNGTPLGGDYLTNNKRTIEIDRKIAQIAMDGDTMSTDAKKSIIGLLKSDIPQNALTVNSDYVLDEDYTTSILFNSAKQNEWLDALEEHSQITAIYVVTNKKAVFNRIKATIKDTLGKISIEESVTFPMSVGFKANAVFFKLGFLDKNAVAMGSLFKEILSTLWMKAGAIGACPVIENTPENMLILPENSFAVLLNETMFAEFVSEMKSHTDIKTIFFITDSEKSFRDMSNEFASATTYQLYRDYLDNFRINTRR